METKFKVGDRVFDIALQKWGKVVHTHPGIKYPVRVILDNGKSRFYTAKGYFNESYRIPRLYHQEMVIVPKDSLERVVQVRDHVNDNWEQRVLIKSLPNKTVLCWFDAETIEEAEEEDCTRIWKYWRELPEKTKITRAEIAEKLGIDIDKLEIID
jgi:hypothetical protein